MADLIQSAYKYQGKPYAVGANGPNAYDCSGFVSRALADIGVNVPHFSTDIYNALPKIPIGQQQAGDVLLFNSPTSPSGRHIAIYIGNGQIIHATRGGVRVTPIGSRNLIGVSRPTGGTTANYKDTQQMQTLQPQTWMRPPTKTEAPPLKRVEEFPFPQSGQTQTVPSATAQGTGTWSSSRASTYEPQGVAGQGYYAGPNRFTVAHRSLPLGSVIEFQTPSGKVAQAMVQDRGPAQWTGREWDLNYPLAQHLGVSGDFGINWRVIK